MSKMNESKLPMFAIVKNRGKGRVLEYHGRGYFTVLLPKDVRLYVHRDNCTFTNKN